MVLWFLYVGIKVRGKFLGTCERGVGGSFLRFDNVSHTTVDERTRGGTNNCTFFYCFANYPKGGLLAAVASDRRTTFTKTFYAGTMLASLFFGLAYGVITGDDPNGHVFVVFSKGSNVSI